MVSWTVQLLMVMLLLCTWRTWVPEVPGKDPVPLSPFNGLLDLSLNWSSLYKKDEGWNKKRIFSFSNMLIVLVLSITLIHYLWTLSVLLLPSRQPSLLLPKELSQIFSLIGSLLGRGEFVCRHILINQSKPVHKIYVCRIKLTFEE